MFPIKKMVAFVFLIQKIEESLEWTPIAPPQFLQTYASRQLQIMRPPAVGWAYVKTPRVLTDIDFKKPKTQSFYKASLLPAQPPVYQFRYKIHDPKEENYQEKSEIRVGDSVEGFYSVREPDGYIRLVKYVSDENGFQTQVSHHHTDGNEGSYLFTMTRHIT